FLMFDWHNFSIQTVFRGFFLLMLGALLLIKPTFQPTSAQANAPTLEDFWEGRADWVLDVFDVGLPIGESDTVYQGDGLYWSYLHASNQSAGVIDQCGQPVEFPGCLTRWESTDNGQNFSLPVPVCMIPCGKCPCSDEQDQITAQQYPRVAFVGDSAY